MKKIWMTIVIVGLLAACGDSTEPGTSTNVDSNNTTAMNNASSNGMTGGNNTTTPANATTGGNNANNAAIDAGGPSDMGSEVDAGAEPDMAAPVDMAQPDEYGDPSMVGDFAVSTQSATTTLGGDSVPLTIYTPMGAGPHPIVVFHHGFMLSPSLYASYGERLASWGYIAVFPEMPGAFIGGPTHVDLKNNMVELMDWVEAEVGAGNLDGDASQIALAGHSLGGKISLLTATEDSRVKGVFAIDPVDSAPPGTFDTTNYPSVAPELMPQITAPIAIVGETVNATCSGLFCQPCAPADENFEQYYAAATSPTYVMDVLQANHVSFLDDPNCGFTCSACGDGSDDPAVTRALTQQAMIGFLELKVRGEQRARPYLIGMPADTAVQGLATYESKNGF